MFRYIRARSVMVSLWRIGDTSPGRLMAGFYHLLKAGSSKDEALLRSPRTPYPFYWAAFPLTGDRR